VALRAAREVEAGGQAVQETVSAMKRIAERISHGVLTRDAVRVSRGAPVSGPPRPLCTLPLPQHGPHPSYAYTPAQAALP
jgi:hypothetical protein